ncbi:MAG: hotdog fold thioesterase, partial [Saprospiraceae bacterium]|nr:hotdog fold thioesterase [Saprospiraceae bacterium]
SLALDVSITFTKSAKEGDLLTVEAKELHLGNKTSVYQITTTNEAGEILALFKGTAYRTSKEVLE